jgi:hypothetical protein
MDFSWAWVERGSWLGVILGFPVGFFFGWVQLRDIARHQRGTQKELKRTADELSRRPALTVGFPPIRWDDKGGHPASECTVRPRWSETDALSDPIEIVLQVINNGSRSARDVLFSIDALMEDMSPLQCSSPWEGAVREDVEGVTRARRIPEGALRFDVRLTAPINPRWVVPLYCSIRLPRDRPRVALRCGCALSDEPAWDTVLPVRVERPEHSITPAAQ